MNLIKKVFTGEIKGIDEKEMTLTAYVSTGAVDRHGESVDPAGADFSNFKKNPVVLWAHNYDQPPIGKALWVKRDGNGIISKVKFAGTAFAQEIFQLYKEGFLKAFSIGFMPDFKNIEDGDGDKKPRRTYRKWEMLEYSAVPVPANPEALTMAVQKGVLKDETIKQAITAQLEPVDEWDDPPEDKPSVTGLEDMLAENTLLEEKVLVLEKENGELRYKIYELLNEKRKKLLEMTVDNLAGKTFEIMNGVIRQATGKVN